MERSSQVHAQLGLFDTDSVHREQLAAAQWARGFAGDKTDIDLGGSLTHSVDTACHTDAGGHGHSPASLRESPHFLIRLEAIVELAVDVAPDLVLTVADRMDVVQPLLVEEPQQSVSRDSTYGGVRQSPKVQALQDRLPSFLRHSVRGYRQLTLGIEESENERDGRQYRQSCRRRR